MKYQRSSQLFEQAKKTIPGGVNSPVRAFSSVGGTPVFFKRAKGVYLYDEDGNKYIDYINSWGPMILGHCKKSVTKKVVKQLKKGTSFGAPTELETKIANLIVSMVPNIDKVRMVNSGTEACMSAVRLARGFTGKEKFIKFEGCYHGHSDSFLIKAGSGVVTFGSPNSSGVTKGTAKDTLLAIYNDIESVKKLIESNENQIAAIIIEPVAGNMGCIPPKDNFLKKLRKICDENSILLIFDEVMTGFRLAKGGAQELFDVKADIVTFGKIIGGGMPVGAFAARDEIMNHLSPMGNVYQAGTLSGNPIAMSSGFETLKTLDKNPKIYKSINKKTAYLAKGIAEKLTKNNIDFTINTVGSMISLHFIKDEIKDFESAEKANNDTFKKFYHHMLDNGIYLPPSAFETWFISKSLSYKNIDKTIEIISKFEI